MARPTKLDIERNLLSGKSITWADGNKSKAALVLGDAKERRLFSFLLNSNVREARDLTKDFIDGLWAAYSATEDPASIAAATPVASGNIGPWRLQSIETEGFGGVNIWGGPVFHYGFDQESLLIEGPNGSGKSSLIGAILWAISGERLRDQADGHAHESKPVYGEDDQTAGDWPPLACYPPSAAGLKSSPYVRVLLTFQDPQGKTAIFERTLKAGKVAVNVSPDFDVPSILLETGLLMPARLGTLRLKEGSDRLTDAVQKLTGLDDLAAIGTLTEGLCHKGREYLSYEKRELATNIATFDQAIEDAREALERVNVVVPKFIPENTEKPDGEMANFGKTLKERSAELTQVISEDLAKDLDLGNLSTQNQVISAIGFAQEDLKTGLEKSSSWKTLDTIGQECTEQSIKQISAAITEARTKAAEAVDLLEKSTKDPKFQLKAVAAQWHKQHQSGAIENCTLCDHSLKDQPSLVQELEALRSAGAAAARKFDDNLRNIISDLEASLPAPIKRLTTNTDLLSFVPCKKLQEELQISFSQNPRYSTTLIKFTTLTMSALKNAPAEELAAEELVPNNSVLEKLDKKIVVIERLLSLAEWFSSNAERWRLWWQPLVAVESPQDNGLDSEKTTEISNKKSDENLSAHLLRLSDALGKAEPYRKAAEAMRKAWKTGKAASEIQNELNRREEVTDNLKSLKNLVPLSQAIARDAIEELSERISQILKRILLTEQLKFHAAQLKRKEGLVVRGGFGPKLSIDATLVANTSWLRATLWAFLFALREEAIEQFKKDLFPLLVFDDPQSTFDYEHRHRWAQYLAALQAGPSKAQIILTTYDEMFLELIKTDGVTGRQAMIAAASGELGYVGIFEGESIDRKWSETTALNTPKAGRDFMSAARIYVEGMLRLMLRGEDPSVSSFVVGDSRNKLEQLNASGGGVAPWNRSEFKRLIGALGNSVSPIKHMEIAHHASGAHLGMAEATDVEIHWRKKLRPALERGFRLAREHHLLHGGLKALHAPLPTATLPNGYKAQVKDIPLTILGRAAALTDGRIADGRFSLHEFTPNQHQKIVLAQHHAYRLTARTLEPVAHPGDILIVKESGEPSAKSLVVALTDDRILARRFEIAENHSDIAVLTAQAINPRRIAPPVIAQRSTFTLHKVIGVLYDDSTLSPSPSPETEVCECNGQAGFTNLTTNTLGLVEVVGDSAEPYALNGQYLIIRNEVTAQEALKALDGKPIIAADTDDNRYFKRLRVTAPNQIVLESLDSGGDHGPVVLSIPGAEKNCLARVWPVAGVLFELPN